MQFKPRRLLWIVTLAVAPAACTDTTSATDLNPAGPPMLRQVRLNQRVFDANNPNVSFQRRVFAFGSHELAVADEINPDVTSAIAATNNLRLIIDELLVGNNLEEIACRAPVDDDAFQKVPLGATPDDISRCSTADDVLASTCGGPTAVCICQNEAGCARGTDIVDFGQPVGVLDENQDGATDDTRFIQGSVGIKCGDIDVPIDLDNSYWNPSGDQNKPAQGGFDALGPAIVLAPLGPMPTNLPCNLVIDPGVVDKENVSLCAPAAGEVTAGCTPGDLSAFAFRTEALLMQPASFTEAQTGVSRSAAQIYAANVPLDETTIDNVTITEMGGAAFTDFTVKLSDAKKTLLQITLTTPLNADTTYEVTFPPAITDSFAQGLPAPQVVTFTTGAN